MFTISSIILARKGLVNQSGDMPNRVERIRLISPKFWLNRPRNTKIEMKAGTA